MLESVGPEILNLKENGKPQKLTILRTCWQKIDNNSVDSQKKATDVDFTEPPKLSTAV